MCDLEKLEGGLMCDQYWVDGQKGLICEYIIVWTTAHKDFHACLEKPRHALILASPTVYLVREKQI